MKCIFSSQKLFPYIRQKKNIIDLLHPLNLHEKYQFGPTDYISRALKWQNLTPCPFYKIFWSPLYKLTLNTMPSLLDGLRVHLFGMGNWDPLHVNTLELMNKQSASIFNNQNWVIIERIFIQKRNNSRETNKPLKITI